MASEAFSVRRAGEKPRILLISGISPPNRRERPLVLESYRRVSAFDVHVAADRSEGCEAFDATHPLPITRLPLHLSGWGLARPASARDYAVALWHLNRLVSAVRPHALHSGKALHEGLLALAIKKLRNIPFVAPRPRRRIDPCCHIWRVTTPDGHGASASLRNHRQWPVHAAAGGGRLGNSRCQAGGRTPRCGRRHVRAGGERRCHAGAARVGRTVALS